MQQNSIRTILASMEAHNTIGANPEISTCVRVSATRGCGPCAPTRKKLQRRASSARPLTPICAGQRRRRKRLPPPVIVGCLRSCRSLVDLPCRSERRGCGSRALRALQRFVRARNRLRIAGVGFRLLYGLRNNCSQDHGCGLLNRLQTLA